MLGIHNALHLITSYRRAASLHRCYECRLAIPRGTHYWKISGCWDGEVKCWSHYTVCAVCEALLTYVSEEHRLNPELPPPPPLGSLHSHLSVWRSALFPLPELWELKLVSTWKVEDA